MEAYLRKATKEDCDLLYEWVNDDAVRKSAFSTEKIRYEEHKKWFFSLLQDVNRAQYIYIYNDETVGQIRIDIDGNMAEIDYSICISKRGMGHGKNMLQLLYNQVILDFPNVKKLVGKVKTENIASQRVFLDMGYEEVYRGFEINIDKPHVFKECVFENVGIIFLTNNKNAMGLFDWLSERENVILFSERVTYQQIIEIQPRLIISYNYIYMIDEDIISYMRGNIINMHISYLPWNRGFSPNIWSFIDDTPKGVTIHQINGGLDKGRILYQKECFFDTKEETFLSTYEKLNADIVELFKEHWEDIKVGKYELKEQIGKGTYHSKKDLHELQKKVPFEWSDNIAEFLRKYHKAAK